MNFNENITNGFELLKTHELTNSMHKLLLCHFVIAPVIQNHKCIDVMRIYDYHLICIFMNIDKTLNIGKTGGKLLRFKGLG